MGFGFDRLSSGLKNTGWALTVLGMFGVLAPLLVPVPAHRQDSADACYGVGIFLLLIGIPPLLLYYFSYKVYSGHALLIRNGKVKTEGFYFGLPPTSTRDIRLEKRMIEILNLHISTPDDGVLGASITVTYSPNIHSPRSLANFPDYDREKPLIESRVQAALTGWAMEKPLPGTLKRAMAMQKEAEAYIRGKLSGSITPTTLDEDLSLARFSGFTIPDIGVRVHDVNIIKWTALEPGSGKPDWGDGDHTVFDTKAILKQFELHAGSLSELRAVKAKLLERYKEEAEDIEDIYDQVRISMKEHQER
jgi:hypothetical protein